VHILLSSSCTGGGGAEGKKGGSAAAAAAAAGDVATVGADSSAATELCPAVNQRDFARGFTPLHRAAALAHVAGGGYLEIYEYLLVRRAGGSRNTRAKKKRDARCRFAHAALFFPAVARAKNQNQKTIVPRRRPGHPLGRL
jgi:hypothetical protein